MENPQQRHYDDIHAIYAAHYYDATALAYREEFILSPLFQGLDLDGCRIADLACGYGYTSLALKQRFPRSNFIGFDISKPAQEAYERTVGFPAYRVDISAESFVETARSMAPFDAAVVVGGLHHCVSNFDVTLGNIALLLKPDGYLLMVEPNAEFLLEFVRKFWYRSDKYFHDETESTFVHEEILDRAAALFRLDSVRFFGGPAYYLLLNSLLFRLPISLKPALQKPLFALERLFNHLPGRAPFPAFMARWRRR
jgi:SAM-dependent methyltransferase